MAPRRLRAVDSEPVVEDESVAPPRLDPAWFDVLGKAGLTTPIEHALVRYTGVSLVSWATRVHRGLEYIPTLLLTTVGRRTGELRQTAVGYYVDEGRLVVVGSVDGTGRRRDWLRNLEVHPLVWATINRKQHACDARVATGAERDRLWATIVARVPEHELSAKRAGALGAELAVVVCTPREAIAGLRPW